MIPVSLKTMKTIAPDWGCNLFLSDSIVTTRKRSCGKVMFSQASVILFTGEGSWSLSRGFSVQGGSPSWEGLCPVGLSVWQISVWGVSVQGDLCLGVSVQGDLSGGLCHGDLPYSNERVVGILLECILFIEQWWEHYQQCDHRVVAALMLTLGVDDL